MIESMENSAVQIAVGFKIEKNIKNIQIVYDLESYEFYQFLSEY